MKIDLTRYAPPGMDLSQEKGFFGMGMCGAVLYSMLFILEYFNEYRNLWQDWDMGEIRVLYPGAQMEPFMELLDDHLMGYLLLAVCMLAIVAIHYAYYRQGSKSIYLMRRLPDGKLLRRTCWTLPMLGIGLSLLAAVISFVIYLGIYVIFTPPECMPLGQW